MPHPTAASGSDPLAHQKLGLRPLRADARRNRESLIAAARALFSEQGTDAPLDEVARRAGIGNATMYRHFPDRRELLIAVYADEVETLCGEGVSLLDEPSSHDALFTWLRAFITHVATKRDLAIAIPNDHAGERSALFDHWHAAMHTTAAALLARAQAEGMVHRTLDPADLLALVSGIALATANAEQAERCLALLRGGVTVHQR